MAVSKQSVDQQTSEWTPPTYIEATGEPVQLPNAALMYDAEFSRAGANDLKLSAANGEELVILNYFAGDTPQPLVAPNQTVLDGATVELLAGPLFPGQVAQAGPATNPDSIGAVQKLEGSASVQHADGTTKQLEVGDLVFESDVITTGKSSMVGIKLADGTLLTLQESGKAVLSEFNFEAGGSDNSALLSILEGTFSMLAGQVAPTGDMKIATPIATMGVRGTSILGVDVNAPGGRLSLTQDPDGHVGFIEVFNNLSGEMFTVLRTVFSKISVSETGMLVLSPKSPNEAAFDQTLTQLLHDFHSGNDTPQAGPQNQNAPQGSSPNFTPPDVQEVVFGPETPGADTITIPPELFFDFLIQLFNLLPPPPPPPDPDLPPPGPIAGDIRVRPIDEDDNGTDASMVEGVLPFNGGVATLADLDGDPVLDANGEHVVQGEEVLVYSWDPETNTLTALADQEPIFSIELTGPNNGDFKITLIGAVNHSDGVPIGIEIDYQVIAPNGATTTGEINFAIEDGEPQAVGDVALIDEHEANFVVFIDVSGSMGANPGVDGYQTRLQLAQESVRQLFLNVAAAEVLIVAFADQAHAAFFDNFADGEAFVTSLVAGNTVIDGVNLGNGTNYQAALQAAMDAWNNGPGAGDLDYVHFLTDGVPGAPVDAQLQAAWEAFLAANGAQESFAVGIGDGLTGNEAALDPIAWRHDNPNSDPIFVNDENDLIETLVGTIMPHNVLEGDGADDFGPDGPGFISSIEIDGVTYHYTGDKIEVEDGDRLGDDFPQNGQFNFAQFDLGDFGDPFIGDGFGMPPFIIDGDTLHVMTDIGGFFTFQFADSEDHKAGDWEYVPPFAGHEGDDCYFGEYYFEGEFFGFDEPVLPYENFRYTIEDADGSQSTANLTVVFDGDRVDGVHHGTSGDDAVEGDSESAEVLVGSLGADTFVLNSEIIADFIADYNFGEGDQIDLSSLISLDLNNDDIANFINIEGPPDGVDHEVAAAELQIDGSGSGQNFTTVAYLNSDAGVSVVVNDAGDTATVNGAVEV